MKTTLKEAWAENPIGLAVAFTMLLSTTAAVAETISRIQGRRAYAKAVKYRISRRL